jgi:DNA-directed DNA polymerase III PolC
VTAETCAPAYLHCHSHYSHLWGTASPASLCATAVARRSSAIALTDVNGLYGLVPFLREAKGRGLKALVGVELREGGRGAERLVMLAANARGYRTLGSCVSRYHVEGRTSLPELLLDECDGVVVLCPPGPLLERLRRSLPPHEVLFMEVTPATPFRRAMVLSKELGVPPVASWPVSFPDPMDRETHLLARAIALCTSEDRVPHDQVAPASEYMPSAEEFVRRFSVWPEALANNHIVAGRCAQRWDLRDLVAGHRAEGPDQRDRLRQRCYQGAQERYGGVPPDVAERLERELSVIAGKGFSGYFLLVERLVGDAPLRCGRGSAASSLVSYCLGLTDVDPLEHDLLFERFLSEGRPDPPDIDIDLPWDERHSVLKAALARLGPKRAAMVATHVCMKLAGAVHEVGKAVGLPPRDVTKVTRRLRYRFEEMDPRKHPLFRDLRLGDPWPHVLGRALRLRGMPKYLSVHCGGIVVEEPSLWTKVPVQKSRMGLPVVQWDKDQIEEAGLLKIDILGNRSLAVVRDAVATVRRRGKSLPPYRELTPFDDPATRSLIATGDTVGVFYAESPAMRQLLAKANRGDFPHLVIHSSIIRPAAYHYLGEYLKRLKGGRRPPLHPRAERILSRNYGLMFYQEDVARVATEVGCLSAAEAEQLRRTLAKKPGHVPLGQFRDRFLRGAWTNGLSDDEALELWGMVASFAGYSFCKAHSASYAMVSFKCGFLKAHYPAQFMAAVLTNGGWYYGPLAYIWDARRHGVLVLPPHINESRWQYTAKGTEIRVGFMAIKGIGREFARGVGQDRAGRGPYRSLEDFWHRVSPNVSQLGQLIKAGCFDGLMPGRNRSQLLWVPRALSQRRPTHQLGLWTEELVAPSLPPPSPRELWRQEVQAFGFPLSGTPLDPYRGMLSNIRPFPADQLPEVKSGRTVMAGWLLTRKPAETKDGEAMEFLSFDDGSGLFDVTVFPDTWRTCACHLRTGGCYLVKGRIEKEYGVISVTADAVTPLSHLAQAA